MLDPTGTILIIAQCDLDLAEIEMQVGHWYLGQSEENRIGFLYSHLSPIVREELVARFLRGDCFMLAVVERDSISEYQ